MCAPDARADRVLVVEDEDMVRNLLQRMLERHGYDVDAAESGEEALTRVRDLAPDAVLLDMFLPGIGGVDVCRTLKCDPLTSHIPILMLSGDGGVESHAAGQAAGATAFVTKPFEQREILRLLREAIAAAQT